MNKFGNHVIHVLDCPETQKPTYSTVKGLAVSYLIKQICPHLLPVSDRDLTDYNEQLRQQVEADCKA